MAFRIEVIIKEKLYPEKIKLLLSHPKIQLTKQDINEAIIKAELPEIVKLLKEHLEQID